ncbi:MAG: peptidoglycan DD-metalloendopeptidase family protein [Eubacteriales bacterium]
MNIEKYISEKKIQDIKNQVIKIKENATKLKNIIVDRVKAASFEQKSAVVAGFAVVLSFAIAFAPVGQRVGTDVAIGTEPAKPGVEAPLDKDVYMISIGGEKVLAVATKEDAEAVYEGIKYYYLDGKVDDPTAQVAFDRAFEWNVYNAKKQNGENAWVMSPVDAVNYILKGKGETKVHTVVGGDTLWDIAAESGITLEELLAINPGITENSLPIGQSINLTEYVPYMEVTTVQQVAVTESIPYETVYQNTDTLYNGQTKVSTPGQNGSKDVVKKVTKVNGVMILAETVSETVTSQPQTQVALKGTKAMSYDVVASIDTTQKGMFAWPMSHVEISSGFGTSRGSARHTGVDLRNPVGTPIGAAEDGVVVDARYRGSYGNIVKIDHGNGFQTWYAHCDKLLVAPGTKVVKGQTIATVGLTGYTTGAHCHFEVRVNGVAKNPLNYL